MGRIFDQRVIQYRQERVLTVLHYGRYVAHITIDVVLFLAVLDGLFNYSLLQPEGQPHRQSKTQVRHRLFFLFLQTLNLLIHVEHADIQRPESDAVIVVPVLDGSQIIMQLNITPIDSGQVDQPRPDPDQEYADHAGRATAHILTLLDDLRLLLVRLGLLQ